MSRSVARLQVFPAADGNPQHVGTRSLQTIDNVLCSLFEHARPTVKEISEWASDRKGFGLAWVLLEFIKTGRALLPLERLDLSDFSLGAGKLTCLFSSLPEGPHFVETLRCSPHVCKDKSLSVLLSFFERLKGGGTGGGTSICLKTLDLSKCDLDDIADVMFLLLPRSVEHLDLSGNRLRTPSMTVLSSVLALDRLPHLLSFDLSDNPLGPSGLRALSRGLSSPTQVLHLQSLKLARTKVREEGVETLAEALKARKTTSLQTLDLEGNDMRAGGLKQLASAVNEEAVPHLRVLTLKENKLTRLRSNEVDFAPLAEFLSTSALKELEELDLSDNPLYVGGNEGDFAFAAALLVPGRFPKLRRLNLGGFPMHSGQVEVFATALGVEGAPSFEELVLSHAGEGESSEGIVALANALGSGHQSQLRAFRMHHRGDILREAFVGFSGSLGAGKNPNLRSLELFVLSRGDGSEFSGGVSAMAEVIREGGLSSLENFRLNIFVRSTDGAALASLGEALGGGGCPSLQKLDFALE
uniref:Uncharacterized protein n=1 Tax=Chromera velia CCMP2878 TaxID=1169474 RepID=A0A0G4I7X8_9ALVE|eukprot:Cvel_11798.t1-p1 / transcript=Cvel_11798.t1 / gene=Cvel_11798 / organism=Chromera_velia_CCMP2878 / gene_product=hypothetical protein / transcript_product=hypothetical protein / location=Cvel_scaffold750:58698-61961(+) / protein_length=526 / sequence_SO=supercontig / SO=protein_coding / is_pseudo=false